MRALSSAEVLKVWDEGDARHDVDRALVLLRFGLPERDPAWLSRLPIGRRDGFLLHLRRATFGGRIVFVVLCPHCGEKLEDEASVDELLLSDPYIDPPESFRTTNGAWELTYRLVDSRDLAEVAELEDGAAARSLARRCLLSARRAGEEVGGDQLDEAALVALAASVAEADPQSEIEFGMNCPACRHAWPLTLDIAGLFWNEVVNRAKLVLRDVAALAARYGWSEHEILSMSPSRRAFYLEQVRE